MENNNKRYCNYHKHDYYGNFVSLDTITSMEDYFKRAKELGHTIFFTVNHGFQGNMFEAKALSEKYEMKVVMGAEGYYVPDNKEKDKSNRHIIIVALNDDGARQLNEIMSSAFVEGFYYKPRIDDKLLFSLNPNNFVITTACVAGLWNNEPMVIKLKEYFKENFFLEVQDHNQEIQKTANTEILRLHYKYDIPIIHANDSHYIYATNNENAEEVIINGKKYKLLEANRDLFLRAKGIIYEEETSFILDYPDYETIVERYKMQGILNDKEIQEAIENTLVFDKADNLGLVDYDIKLPPVSDNPEKELKSMIKQSWNNIKYSLPREKWKEYIEAIKYEVDIINKTKMENYFILDQKIVDKAQRDYNGKLTHTGRGSAPSFYTTRLLGLTDIDRLDTPITLFPTRFMSIERILGAKSLPDIDLNTANAIPFIRATEDLLGKENCAWMIAWKPLQKASAFRLYCKAIGMEMEDYNEVAKDISAQAKIKKESKYEEDDVWGPIIKASAPFVGVVESIADSPCFTKGHLVYTDKGYKKIENINIGDNVLTHRNRFKKVKNIMQKQTDELLELKISGSPIIECTEEHPFYVKELIGRKYFKKSNQEKYSSVRKFTNPFWKKAIDLNKKDYIGMAINQKKVAYKNEENYNLPFDNNNFWWIIGRYLGDGWIKKNRRTDNKDKFLWHFYICTSKEKKEQTELEEKLFGLFNYTKTDNGTTMKYDIFSKELALFVEQFGKHSYEKYIPQNIIDLPKDNLKSLIEGYISADGYKPNGRNTIILTTVSPKMAFSFQQCVHKVYNVPASVSLYKKETLKSSFYEGREIKHQNDVYRISYNLDGSRYKGFYDKEYMWFPVREINLINKTECTVYNLEVEDDESYTIFNNIVHNCSMLVYDKPVNREIGLIRTREGICCLLDGYNCDKYKYLKNDYLTVQVWAIIKDTCDLVGIPVPSISELNKLLDKKTYDIYAKGLTCTINQADSNFATPLVKRYQPKSPSEMSAFVAIIRPGCKSLLEDFINRKPYTTGVKELDTILEDSGHRMIYQESIMKYLIWLGVSEPHSYDIIKKIAKKKFKEQELKELKAQLVEGWVKQVGKEDGFEETWRVVEDASKYSFNACVSGDTIIQRAGVNGEFNPTIEEMYLIRNNYSYAKKTRHLPLYNKYRNNGYGNALSMFDDNRIRKNQIIDIRQSGIKDIYRVMVETGEYIDCTLNHKFPTPIGDKKLEELKIGSKLFIVGEYEKHPDNYRFTDGNFISNIPKKGQRGFQKIPNGNSVMFNNLLKEKQKNKCRCEMCEEEYEDTKKFELHHIDEDRTNNNHKNLKWLCNSCHKKEHYRMGRKKTYEKGIPAKTSKIISIEYLKTEMVYDIEMKAPAHNFISKSGLITCNSHSLSYAYDSLYGAYLKSHYPLEYYTVVLNNYKDDEDRTNKLIKELQYFGISLLSPQFGKSIDKYFMDKKTNSIYKGIASLKYLNQDVSVALYNLAQENHYDYFTDLLYDIWKKTSLDQRQLEILIKCGYFGQFGEIPLLLGLAKEFKSGKNRIYNTLKEETILKRKDIIKELEINKEIKDDISNIDILRFKMQNGIDYQISDKSHSNKEFIVADINFMGKSKKAKSKVYQLSTGRLLDVKFHTVVSNGKSVNQYDYIMINNIKNENKWYRDENEEDPSKQWKRFKEEDNQKELVVYNFNILNKNKE